METPYCVLIVEDVTTYAELNERVIQEALKPCVFQWVETEEAFLKALDEFSPDIIISDYMMPVFDGMIAQSFRGNILFLTRSCGLREIKIHVDSCPNSEWVLYGRTFIS